MRFFKNMTSPMPRLRLSPSLWLDLTGHLEATSRGVRESGAFLLGTVGADGVRRAASFVPYEMLNPQSLQRFAVHMPQAAFSRLFAVCEERHQEVVADIHAHPMGAGQSPSDMANPMVPLAGHVALIVPCYAKNPVRLTEMTFNVYDGPGKWRTARGKDVNKYLEITS